MLKVHILLASTRDGRNGEHVAKWVLSELKGRSEFTSELMDLKNYHLPFVGEPASPSEADVVMKWKEKMREGDAYIFVIPEYNHGYPGALKNAIDHLKKEINRKPVVFVSYSDGLGAGIRSTEQLRLVLVHFEVAPLLQAVHIPSVDKQFDEKGTIKDEFFVKRLNGAIDALLWWGEALKVARNK